MKPVFVGVRKFRSGWHVFIPKFLKLWKNRLYKL